VNCPGENPSASKHCKHCGLQYINIGSNYRKTAAAAKSNAHVVKKGDTKTLEGCQKLLRILQDPAKLAHALADIHGTRVFADGRVYLPLSNLDFQATEASFFTQSPHLLHTPGAGATDTSPLSTDALDDE